MLADITYQWQIPKPLFMVNLTTTFHFQFMNISETLQWKCRRCPNTQILYFCKVQDFPNFSINFRKKKWWKLAMLSPRVRINFSTDVTIVTCWDVIMNLLLVNDAAKFLVKFRILFANFLPNSARQKLFLLKTEQFPV